MLFIFGRLLFNCNAHAKLMLSAVHCLNVLINTSRVLHVNHLIQAEGLMLIGKKWRRPNASHLVQAEGLIPTKEEEQLLTKEKGKGPIVRQKEK